MIRSVVQMPYIRRLSSVAFVGSHRHIARSLSSSLSSPSSSVPPLVALEMDANSGIATVTMQNPPVNSLSLEMNLALAEAVRTARREPSIQALVLQSSNPKIYSAGLDLQELHKPDPARLVKFWKSFQQLYLDLYGSRLATVAAIEGHAPAAGCMLALSCDYRVLADDPKITIGLNESRLGIVAPPWLGQQLVDTVGRRNAELALALGTLFGPSNALEIQLVDRVVPRDQVRSAAREVAAEFAQIPATARVASKMMVRKHRLDRLANTRQEDVENFVQVITNDKVQKGLEAYLASLGSKKSS